MALPLPGYEPLGSQVVNELNKLDQIQLLNEQIKAAQQANEFNPQFNQMKMKQVQDQAARQAQTFPEELKAKQLANQLSQLQVSNYLPQAEASNALKSAQANNLNLLNQLPFAGRQLPGAAGEALAVDMIKKQYGENSPQYQSAKSNYDLRQEKIKQGMDYQRSLMGSQSKRSATPLAKAAMEQEDIRNGFMPGTVDETGQGVPISKEQQKTLTDQYKNQVIKSITDTKTRERALFARNMDVTIDSLDPNDLTIYSGPKGQIQLGIDIARSSAGENVPRYIQYQKALTSANTLAKQVRQFYGDSITPSVQEGLKELTNPTNWFQNPEVAKEKYNQFVKILDRESNTFFDALHSASVYEKPEKKSKSNTNSNIMTYNPATGRLE